LSPLPLSLHDALPIYPLLQFNPMTRANIQRLIGVAAPLWAGEAEVVRAYWTSPGRSLRTDLLWLQRQCFKEFWGSGVGKYDRGGDRKSTRLNSSHGSI